MFDFTAIQGRNLKLSLLIISGLVLTSVYDWQSIAPSYLPAIDEQEHNKIQNLTASDISSSLADDDVNNSFVMTADDAATGAGAQELRIDEHEEAVNMFYLEASSEIGCGLGHLRAHTAVQQTQ
jgi:hypothetical protein